VTIGLNVSQRGREEVTSFHVTKKSSKKGGGSQVRDLSNGNTRKREGEGKNTNWGEGNMRRVGF